MKTRSYIYVGYLLVASLSFLLLSGCGYTLQGKATLPFKSITLGKIINKTFEPGLEDRMQLALIDELMKNGFSIDKSGQHRVEGIINTLELRTLSTKSGVAVEYEVIVRGEFSLIEAKGKTKPLRNSGAYIVSFLSKDSLHGVMAMKEKAIGRALRDLSSELAVSIIY